MEQDVGKLITGLGPDVNTFVIALFLGDDTITILFTDLINLGFCLIDNAGLFFRNDHVGDTDRETGFGRMRVTKVFQLIKNNNGA